MDDSNRYQQASLHTAENLRSIAASPELRGVSRLSLPEVEAVSDLVSRMVPAGNVPGIILTALKHLGDSRVPAKTVERDIHLLFRGVEQTVGRAFYTAAYAGPGAILWGYQNLLKLAGKSPETAFPQGVWQFYVEYALREDAARHASETHGFDTALRQHNLRLSPADRLAAWIIAASQVLYQYDDLLANEWRERAACNLLRELTQEKLQAYRAWQKQIPYRRSVDAAGQTYAQFRRARFNAFLSTVLAQLDASLQQEFRQRLQALEAADLRSYQRQMTILAYLQPGGYNETIFRYPFTQAHIGVVCRGYYYLIPASPPDRIGPLDALTARRFAAACLEATAVMAPASLVTLTRAPRAVAADLRTHLSAPLLHELNALRHASILLNNDLRPRTLSLAEIRQAERGVGDHALTIFDTGSSFVFDESHIFFDGGWGAALAEIMTNEALSWAVYLAQSAASAPPPSRQPPLRLSLPFQPSDQALLRTLPQLPPESSAETEAVKMNSIMHLRRVFKQRSDLLGLTINDLLVLYRAIHACLYQPAPALLARLEELAKDKESRQAARLALEVLGASRQNPALLIPIDASQHLPRERVYPFSFSVPLVELDLLNLHQRSVAYLASLASGYSPEVYGEFETCRKTYLAALAGFGEVLSRAKELAGQGQSPSAGAIKALAHLPPPVQRLFEQLPVALEPLNDLLKGREVFSNIGAVAPGSTLLRFQSAKDDNQQKTLVWGVLTDERGVMHISLRDFRPHVAALAAIGHFDLAQQITSDYLNTYAQGLNRYVVELYQIAIAGHRPLASNAVSL